MPHPACAINMTTVYSSMHIGLFENTMLLV